MIHCFVYEPVALLPYIDWSYFFHAWGIKYRQQGFDEAVKLKEEAVSLLKKNNSLYKVRALFRLCDAKSDGDDLLLEKVRLPLLRQQHNRSDIPNLCLSDFVSPYGDKVGVFATSVVIEDETFVADDTYRYILVQTLADRLTEAAASCMHSKVRTDRTFWGYSPDEHLTPEELNRETYIGIRPAIGYPSLPDQSVIFIIDELLGLSKIGITITSNGAMSPHSSVCGLMLGHPAAKYFEIGKISEEQFNDYVHRRGMPVEEIRKFLARNMR